MKMLRKISLYSSIILLLFATTSCFKEDARIKAHQPGAIASTVIPMTQDYHEQVYFNLNQGRIVSQNGKSDWDLGFQSTPDGWQIILNTAVTMHVAHTGNTDMNVPVQTATLNWLFDLSDGSTAGNAIGTWYTLSGNPVSKKEVLVIDRGLDESYAPRGYKKLIIDTPDAQGNYRIIFAELDGSNMQQMTIPKQTGINYVRVNLNGAGSILQAEPPTSGWDLLFTQYTTTVPGPDGKLYPYLVTGVLQNPAGCLAAIDTVNTFDQVTFQTASAMILSSSTDIIGYDWKMLSGDPSQGPVSYLIRPKRVFIIKDNKGYYYKLRFTGFYNDQGVKGYPTFDYQQL
jgi:hypothetical protein